MPLYICMAWLLRTGQRCVSQQDCYCHTGHMVGVLPTEFWKLEGFLGMKHEVVTEFGLLQGFPWLRRSVAGLSPRRPLFYPRPVFVRFLVGKGTLG
jgi:hypothetical protein